MNMVWLRKTENIVLVKLWISCNRCCRFRNCLECILSIEHYLINCNLWLRTNFDSIKLSIPIKSFWTVIAFKWQGKKTFSWWIYIGHSEYKLLNYFLNTGKQKRLEWIVHEKKYTLSFKFIRHLNASIYTIIRQASWSIHIDTRREISYEYALIVSNATSSILWNINKKPELNIVMSTLVDQNSRIYFCLKFFFRIKREEIRSINSKLPFKHLILFFKRFLLDIRNRLAKLAANVDSLSNRKYDFKSKYYCIFHTTNWCDICLLTIASLTPSNVNLYIYPTFFSSPNW